MSQTIITQEQIDSLKAAGVDVTAIQAQRDAALAAQRAQAATTSATVAVATPAAPAAATVPAAALDVDALFNAPASAFAPARVVPVNERPMDPEIAAMLQKDPLAAVNNPVVMKYLAARQSGGTEDAPNPFGSDAPLPSLSTRPPNLKGGKALYRLLTLRFKQPEDANAEGFRAYIANVECVHVPAGSDCKAVVGTIYSHAFKTQDKYPSTANRHRGQLAALEVACYGYVYTDLQKQPNGGLIAKTIHQEICEQSESGELRKRNLMVALDVSERDSKPKEDGKVYVNVEIQAAAPVPDALKAAFPLAQ